MDAARLRSEVAFSVWRAFRNIKQIDWDASERVFDAIRHQAPTEYDRHALRRYADMARERYDQEVTNDRRRSNGERPQVPGDDAGNAKAGGTA